MGTLSGVLIADKTSPFDAGAAFLLSQKCVVSELVTLSSGWEIEVSQGSPYVVTRIKGTSDAASTFNEAHEAAQQGLDILSIEGKSDLAIRNAADECLIWWREQSEEVLRVLSVANLSVTVGIPTLIVTNQLGDVVPQPPPPAIKYHESLRYIRLSQVTDDLFDAFRNIYLAFELLLEDIVPKQKNEREGPWLKRALTTINKTVPVSRAFSPMTLDIIAEIYKEIYVDMRCAIFHSKKKSRLIPQNLADRRKVNEGLIKLTRIVLLLADHLLHAKRPTGGLYHTAFDLMTRPVLSDSEIVVSDSNAPLNPAETPESPAYINAVPMVTRFAPELSEPGLNFVLGSISVSQLNNLQKIARFGLKQQGNLIMGSVVEEELTYDGIDRLEAQLGIQLRNVREPKRLFRT